MLPTLNDKDIVLVNRHKKIQRYTIVYMIDPKNKEKSVRRVIGLPGENIEYRNDELYIDGNMKVESFLNPIRDKSSSIILTEDFSLAEVVHINAIPKGKYFVLGDSRQNATDSRYYGLVDQKDIIGVVEFRVFPFIQSR